jgi:hypothetical protein
VTVWVREWAEVINTARARLQFINQSLDYEANRDSSKAYLLKAHGRFIPAVNERDEEAEESSVEDTSSIPER